jgi:hypothetical protein
MRCLACDRRLNDRESTRRYSSTGDFIDLCDRCFSTISDDVPDLDDEAVDEGIDENEGDEDYGHFVNYREFNGEDQDGE